MRQTEEDLAARTPAAVGTIQTRRGPFRWSSRTRSVAAVKPVLTPHPTCSSSCKLNGNKAIGSPTHDAQPTDIYENETFQEVAPLRYHRSQFHYFPGRSTDDDFGDNTLPITCFMS
jgi:hypothetical protein